MNPPIMMPLPARLGDWMARHQRTLLAVQWIVIAGYLALVTLPVFLPPPAPQARLLTGDISWQEAVPLIAQYLFWGLWWPFVILSVMLMGRFWCGVLCPEGALSEFASRHGRGLAIPKWLRWRGWPLTAFVLTTVYGQLISVYDYPQATLLILGGSTLVAIGIGYLYGKGKRVWCRYLCPVSGVFALLARLAPVHFRVDRRAWNTWPQRSPAVDCAPLLDIKHMTGTAQCHACGRCSGHRDAVTLAWRSPQAELLGRETLSTQEILLLVFGMIGVANGAFQWSIHPGFVWIRQQSAEWLLGKNILWPFAESPAWWLLTRYPEVNDVFTWLDGVLILIWIAGIALIFGALILAAVFAAARLAGLGWRRLAPGLVPLAGIGLFLGLSMMTVTHLRAEGVALGWLPAARMALLLSGMAWSAWLGLRLIAAGTGKATARIIAALIWLLPVAAMGGNGWLMFFIA
jgi:polyferredoxin